jgi:hypothetical protein
VEASVLCAFHTALRRPHVHVTALDHLTPRLADDDQSPAYAAETALERSARHARGRRGYTIPLGELAEDLGRGI